MAANEYFNGLHGQDTSYHGARREDAPLPSVPQDHHPAESSSSLGISPVTSPFSDHAYPVYPRPSQLDLHNPYGTGSPAPSYGHLPDAASSNYSYGGDPFGDSSAIPLQTQHHNKHLPDDAASPTYAMGEAENQYPPSLLQDRKKERIPRDRDRDNRRRGVAGWFSGRITWAVFILSIIQLIVFIVEIVRNATLTGSPIEIHPSFNPMIGPSPYVLINMGARYVPCMRKYDIPNSNLTLASTTVGMQCPNTTTGEVPASGYCTLGDLCGFGMNLTPSAGNSNPQPNQWFRFITPIFLHGGIVHIGFNLLLQLTLGRDIEKQIGTLRFLLVYFSAGIFGFVFGGNFAPNGIPSTGCSGALFGIIAIMLLDLLYTWKTRINPGRDLLFILLDVAVTFVLGLLPALDNFSHIGGFLTGLVLGICILHSPDSLRERIGLDEPPYSTVYGSAGGHSGAGGTKGGEDSAASAFLRRPVGFFKGRKPLWWAWWLVRAGALVGFLIAFIVLLRNFYVFRNSCGWCKYLSCLPIKNWCDVGNLQFTQTSTPNKVRRALEYAFDALGS